MNLQKFQRQQSVGGSTLPVLGTADIADPNDPTSGIAPAQKDCVLLNPPQGSSGQPVKSILVGVKYEGGGTYAALSTTVWFYEEQTRNWYKMEAAKTLPLNQLTRFLAPSPLLPSQVPDANGFQKSSVGGLVVYVRVDNGSAVDGTYSFVIAADAAP